MKNKSFKTGFILGMLSAAVLAIGIGAGIYFAMPKSTTVSEMSAKKMTLIEKVVDAYYYGKIDKSKMEEGTYKGLVDGLEDPYSEYYTKKEYEEQQFWKIRGNRSVCNSKR